MYGVVFVKKVGCDCTGQTPTMAGIAFLSALLAKYLILTRLAQETRSTTPAG